MKRDLFAVQTLINLNRTYVFQSIGIANKFYREVHDKINASDNMLSDEACLEIADSIEKNYKEVQSV